MRILPNHTALKEWAAVISALRSGDQIVLVRKGGIADPSFGVEADRFYLFPTYLHQREKQFRPQHQAHFAATDIQSEGEEPRSVVIDTWCEVVRVYRLDDLETLKKLESAVIFTASTIDERYRFRADQAVSVLVVRAWTLPEVTVVPNRSEYAGCRSWISVEEAIDTEGSSPVLSVEEFTARVSAVEQIVGSAALD